MGQDVQKPFGDGGPKAQVQTFKDELIQRVPHFWPSNGEATPTYIFLSQDSVWLGRQLLVVDVLMLLLLKFAEVILWKMLSIESWWVAAVQCVEGTNYCCCAPVVEWVNCCGWGNYVLCCVEFLERCWSWTHSEKWGVCLHTPDLWCTAEADFGELRVNCFLQDSQPLTFPCGHIMYSATPDPFLKCWIQPQWLWNKLHVSFHFTWNY